MALVLNLHPHKYKFSLRCLFVIYSGRFFIVLLGGVLLDSDRLPTTLRDSRQRNIKIDHNSTMYSGNLQLSNVLMLDIPQQCDKIGLSSAI